MSLKTRPDIPVVAVFNASEDTVDFLGVFRAARISCGRSDMAGDRAARSRRLRRFMSEHQPEVIVFDVSFPYQLNWQHFREFQQLGDECRVPVVLTTTNQRDLTEWSGRRACSKSWESRMTWSSFWPPSAER